jgi:hypothetical protein
LEYDLISKHYNKHKIEVKYIRGLTKKSPRQTAQALYDLLAKISVTGYPLINNFLFTAPTASENC